MFKSGFELEPWDWWYYADRVRVVLDTEKAYLSNFTAEPTPNGLTIRIGSIFVSIQAFEYYELLHAGRVPNLDIFYSTFYAMTGFHGMHVTAGVIWLACVWVAALRGKIPQERYMTVELAGLYWHFVDLVWVVLFTIVYLM